MDLRCLNSQSGNAFIAVNGDCVDAVAQLPDDSVGFSVYSPPFSGLYIYNDSVADMGNSANDAEFFEQYAFLLREKLRVTMPGRLSAVHCKDLVYYSNASERGDRGLRDFPGECVRAHLEAGWTFHSRVTIWRCPVREMTKSKPDGLLYKNFRTDAARLRQGLPEYLLVFRKWSEGMDDQPAVMHDYMQWKQWAGEGAQFVRKNHRPDDRWAKEYFEALDIWQQWASPVWMDTRTTDVLNVQGARSAEDERHICPLALDIIERAVSLWSNAGDTVLSPFMGIGSEGVVSLKLGRKFFGVELKESYWRQACKNLDAEDRQGALFAQAAE
jgi:DNA modification methylase